MGRLDEKKKKKREDLLNAAYELFTSQGIFDTSISDIVKKANMAKGTFYLYFRDKYEIRTELITLKAGELFSVVQQKMQGEKMGKLEDNIISLVDIIIEELSADKTLLEFISKNLHWGIFHKVLMEGENEVSVSFYDWYSEMIKASGRKIKNHVLMIYMLVELINSTCYNVILYNEPVSLDELKEQIFALIPSIIKNQEVEA